MTAYAIGHLRNVNLNQGIADYLFGIDATLEPFGGSFIIHGGPKIELEGKFADDLIVISFPDLDAARDWYNSAAYQALVPFRKQGSESDVFLIDGVDRDHKATDILKGSPFHRVSLFRPSWGAGRFPRSKWRDIAGN